MKQELHYGVKVTPSRRPVTISEYIGIQKYLENLENYLSFWMKDENPAPNVLEHWSIRIQGEVDRIKGWLENNKPEIETIGDLKWTEIEQTPTIIAGKKKTKALK